MSLPERPWLWYLTSCGMIASLGLAIMLLALTLRDDFTLDQMERAATASSVDDVQAILGRPADMTGCWDEVYGEEFSSESLLRRFPNLWNNSTSRVHVLTHPAAIQVRRWVRTANGRQSYWSVEICHDSNGRLLDVQWKIVAAPSPGWPEKLNPYWP